MGGNRSILERRWSYLLIKKKGGSFGRVIWRRTPQSFLATIAVFEPRKTNHVSFVNDFERVGEETEHSWGECIF